MDAGKNPPRRARRTCLRPKDRQARRMEFDKLSNRVIGCAIEVHRQLSPGLLESTYEQCLAHELRLNGIGFELQHPQPVQYKGVKLDCDYRLDLLVEHKLIMSGCVVNATRYYTSQVLFVSFVVKEFCASVRASEPYLFSLSYTPQTTKSQEYQHESRRKGKGGKLDGTAIKSDPLCYKWIAYEADFQT